MRKKVDVAGIVVWTMMTHGLDVLCATEVNLNSCTLAETEKALAQNNVSVHADLRQDAEGRPLVAKQRCAAVFWDRNFDDDVVPHPTAGKHAGDLAHVTLRGATKRTHMCATYLEPGSHMAAQNRWVESQLGVLHRIREKADAEGEEMIVAGDLNVHLQEEGAGNRAQILTPPQPLLNVVEEIRDLHLEDAMATAHNGRAMPTRVAPSPAEVDTQCRYQDCQTCRDAEGLPDHQVHTTLDYILASPKVNACLQGASADCATPGLLGLDHGIVLAEYDCRGWANTALRYSQGKGSRAAALRTDTMTPEEIEKIRTECKGNGALNRIKGRIRLPHSHDSNMATLAAGLEEVSKVAWAVMGQKQKEARDSSKPKAVQQLETSNEMQVINSWTAKTRRLATEIRRQHGRAADISENDQRSMASQISTMTSQFRETLYVHCQDTDTAIGARGGLTPKINDLVGKLPPPPTPEELTDREPALRHLNTLRACAQKIAQARTKDRDDALVEEYVRTRDEDALTNPRNFYRGLSPKSATDAAHMVFTEVTENKCGDGSKETVHRHHKDPDTVKQGFRDFSRKLYQQRPTSELAEYLDMVAPDPAIDPGHVYGGLCEHFELDDLEAALSQTASGTAPGEDRTQGLFLKCMPDWLKDTYLKVVNEAYLGDGPLPQEWMQNVIVNLPKSEAAHERHIPAKQRPMSLLSVGCKVYERMTYNRLAVMLSDHDVTPASQNGGILRGSTTPPIETLLDTLTTANRNHTELWGALFDCRKAFDLVSHQSMVNALRHIRVPEAFISAYLKMAGREGKLGPDHGKWSETAPRTARVFTGVGMTGEFPIKSSTMQGSVLGSLMYAIWSAPLLKKLEKRAGGVPVQVRG